MSALTPLPLEPKDSETAVGGRGHGMSSFEPRRWFVLGANTRRTFSRRDGGVDARVCHLAGTLACSVCVCVYTPPST